MRVIFLILFILIGLTLINSLNSSDSSIPITNSITPTTTPNTNQFASPTEGFKSRITKKHFGTYVTPSNSPVSPEKFTGYHTGVDVEFEDMESEVPIVSISDGHIIYSSWTKGYGGLTVVKTQVNNQTVTVLYGHLNPNKLQKVGSQIEKDQQIGILGKGYSTETDSERKHLHLAIHKGDNLVLLGYVQKQPELNDWINPLTLY